MRVRVLPRITVVSTGTAVRVAAEPARPGARVALQVYERDLFPWRTISRARLDSRSRATVSIPAGRPTRLRVVVRGEDGWADAVSQQIVLGG